MKPLLLIAMLLLCPQYALALPMQNFSLLPVAHEGRIKPLSVFAREELRQISGKSYWAEKPAIDWLAAMIFTPQNMHEIRLIRVESDALRQSLQLPPHTENLYPLKELQKAMRPQTQEILLSLLAIQQKQPVTAHQEALAELYGRIRRFQQLQDSLNMFLVFPEAENSSYQDLAHTDPQEISADTAALIAQMEERGRQNNLLAIVPSPWPGDTDWYAPWDLQFNGKAGPQTQAYLQKWYLLAQAYRKNDAALWASGLSETKALVAELGGTQYHPLRLQLEEWYYRLSFLSLAIGCYLTYALACLIPAIRQFAAVPLAAAIGLHGLALVVRMIILQRPPVSNLYESVLFVSFVLAVAGTLLGWRERKRWLPQASALMAGALLILSQTLLTGQEQLSIVMAVLNTDFWLATHVICITSGYAAAVLVSLLAHYALWDRQNPRSLHLFVLAALLLTAVGTLLGGIWADQSWGRFWGWDPKENGALLIVLWLVWLLHGRIAGQIGEHWYLAGMAWLSVIVSLAWFGVNLLSVGLHSYGFTEGTAWGLLAFILGETLLVGFLLVRYGRIEHA